MNAVYKKEVASDDGSLSPGCTDDSQDQASLVDILIQNSKPSMQKQRGSSSIALQELSESRPLTTRDDNYVAAYMQPLKGELSHR